MTIARRFAIVTQPFLLLPNVKSIFKRTNPRMLAILGLFSLYFLFALARQSYLDMDKDERRTSHVIRKDFNDMVAERFGRGHPPLYFVMQWSWVRLWGHTYEALATLNILIGAGGVVFMLLLGRELGLGKWAWGAAAIWSVHPSMTYHVRYLRPYTGVLVFSCAILYLTLLAIRRPSGRVHLWLFLTGVVGAFWNHTLLIFWVCIAVAILTNPPLRRSVGRGYWIAWLGSVAAHFALMQMCKLSRFGEHPLAWIEIPDFGTFCTQMLSLLGAKTLVSDIPSVLWLFPILIFMAMVWAFWNSFSATDSPAETERRARWKLVVVSTLLPLVIFIIVTYTAQPMIQTRYLIICLPGFVLCAAYALSAMPRPVAIAALVVCFPMMAYSNDQVNKLRRLGVRRAIERLDRNYVEGEDVVLFVEVEADEPLYVFATKDIEYFGIPGGLKGERAVQYVRGVCSRYRRLWVIYHKTAPIFLKLGKSNQLGKLVYSKDEMIVRIRIYELTHEGA